MTSFVHLTSPVAVKAAISECDRLTRSVFLRTYEFYHSREFELQFEGRVYDSKAIAAVAYGYQYGVSPLGSDECFGGKSVGSAGWALNRLGFRVTGMRHIGWWLNEVEAAVGAYFEMQRLAESNTNFRKVDHLRQLHAVFPSRTTKAFEFKLQNISAALRDLDERWLQGYAPAPHYQDLVRFVVQDRIGQHPEIDRTDDHGERRRPVKRNKVDWAQRDADNRDLGRAGEQFVLDKQRKKLIDAARPDLASKTKWVANESDGDGYDIESFEADGQPIFIEVKTTTGGEQTPFYLSANELSVWEAKGAAYQVHRVFNFLTVANVRIHTGVPGTLFHIEPCAYRATKK